MSTNHSPYRNAQDSEKPKAAALRRRVGDIEVTALLDGYIDLDESLFVGLDAARASDLAEAAFHEPGAQRTPVAAYLINTGKQRILIDTGTSNVRGPNLGWVPDSLAAAGYGPEDIDILALTHLHPDHVNGAILSDGSATYPNAELVISETEHRFWQDDGLMAQASERAKGNFIGARNGVAPYRDRLRLISDDAEITPGLRAQLLPGHTPGHTGFRIDSGASSLLIWGDITHLAAYQFPEPGWGLTFDTDVELARKTRARVLDQAATDRIMIAGMHLPFPGFGHVARDGIGYRFAPAEWPYDF